MTDTNDTGFRIRHEKQSAAIVVHAGGELDTETADQLDKYLRQVESTITQPTPVLLDLTEITYLSSAGIATLVIHTQRCAELGSRLRVIADQTAILRPITLSGADDAIEIAPTLDEEMTTEHVRVPSSN